MIALVTDTNGLIVCIDQTRPMPAAGDASTWARSGNAVIAPLLMIALVTDTNGLIVCIDQTRPMPSAGDASTWTRSGNAVIAPLLMIAFITDTNGLIVCIDQTRPMPSAGDASTWTSSGNAVIAPLLMVAFITDTNGLIVCVDQTRPMPSASHASTGRAWHIIFHAIGTVRVIANAAKTHRGFTLGNSTDSMVIAGDSFTRVISRGLLAKTILQGISLITDAKRPLSANCTVPMGTTVKTDTIVLELTGPATTCNKKHGNQRQGSLKHTTPPSHRHASHVEKPQRPNLLRP